MNQCLLNNQSTDGDGEVVNSDGGIQQVFVNGVMGSASIAIRASMDNGTTWATIKTITAVGHYSFPFTKGKIKATVSSSTGTTDITVRTYRDMDALVVFP